MRNEERDFETFVEVRNGFCFLYNEVLPHVFMKTDIGKIRQEGGKWSFSGDSSLFNSPEGAAIALLIHKEENL